MTERFYIQRLKQMVHKYGKGLCGHCPLQPRFQTQQPYFIIQNRDYSGCKICRKLAGVDGSGDSIPPCPCPSLKGRDINPYKKALKIIEKWERENGEEL